MRLVCCDHSFISTVPPLLFLTAGVSFGLDTALNAAIYGRGVAVADVLAGRVPPPPQFEPLYRLLHEYARQAGGMRHVASTARLVSRSPSTSPRLHSYTGLPARSARSTHGGASTHGGRSTRGGGTAELEASGFGSAGSSVADAEEERESRGAAAAPAAAAADEPSVHGLVTASASCSER